MMPNFSGNPASGMMNQQASLVQIIQSALAQKGINAEVKLENGKAMFIFSEAEVRKLFSQSMPKDLMSMVTIEKVGEMVLSMRVA